ncbi:MAG: YraN family protein [Bacteroidales bacterium]|nr:YraN family protein [Bacteroidales bacterium]
MEGRDNHRRSLGILGEDIACDFLKDRGHVILERNWRAGHLEIDIITLDADGIHFVEVKTRQKNIQAPPQMNVDHGKQSRITKAALRFLKTGKGVPQGDHECHFDIVAVTFGKDTFSIDWFPQAYIPLYL